MAKSSKPLRIALAHPFLLNTSEVQEELVDKGHQVEYLDLTGFDVVVGPQCSRLVGWKDGTHLRNGLKLVVRAARELRYPKKEKGE